MGPLLVAARSVLVLHAGVKLLFLGLLAALLRERLLDLAPGSPDLHRWLFGLDRLGWGFAAVGVALMVALVHRAATRLEAGGRPGLRTPRALALSVIFPPLQLHAGQATLEDLWQRSRPAGADSGSTAAAPSLGRFWQHWVMGGFAAWLGTFALGVMMIPELVALGVLLVGLLMQLWADLWGWRACSELGSRVAAVGRPATPGRPV